MEKYKKVIKTINLKYLGQRGIKSLDYLIKSDIQIKRIIKKHKAVTDNPPITIYVNQFRIKKGYYFELLMPETMKLLRITKEKNWWKCASFRNYWSSISPFWYCQQLS